MDRADARVIQAGGNRIRFLDLSVLVLHDERTCPVDDALFTQLDRGGAHAGVDALAAGLGQDDLSPARRPRNDRSYRRRYFPPTQAIR